MKARKMKLSELVLDFEIYPRSEVDKQHVYYMHEALAAGHIMPPIVIDRKTRRVIDGFHRYRAYRQFYGEDCEVEVVEKDYTDEREVFLDSIRYNASHGSSLTRHDRVHCILKAEQLQIEPDQVAAALCLTPERVGELRAERVGKLRAVATSPNGKPEIPLKRTISHMAGKTLTARQAMANDKLSGMNQSFYVNQVIMLIENELLDTSNEYLMTRLAVLGKLIEGLAVEV